MASATLLTTDKEIDEALEAAKLLQPAPMATKAEYLRESRVLLVTLKDGRRLAVPVESHRELANASDDELSKVEILGPGTALHFPKFDGNLYVPYLTKTLTEEYGYEPLCPELEEQITQALEDAKYAEPTPAVVHANYLHGLNAIAVHINTGQRLLIPVEDLQDVSSATPEQIQDIEIVGRGNGIGFPAVDAHFSVEGLLAGRYGNRKWMEQLGSRRATALKAA